MFETCWQTENVIFAPVITYFKSALISANTKYKQIVSWTHPYKSSSYDNMRGFDPASEDDREDNGMSRYMENNDEEGWY